PPAFAGCACFGSASLSWRRLPRRSSKSGGGLYPQTSILSLPTSLRRLRQQLRRLQQPSPNKMLQPLPFRRVVHRAVRKVLVARAGAGGIHAVAAAGGPAMHHGAGDVGVELQAETRVIADRLHREIIAGGEELGAIRQLKALAMPVIDLRGPVRAKLCPCRRRPDRVIADLHHAVRVRRDGGTKLLGQHLGAQANPEERTPLAQGDV